MTCSPELHAYRRGLAGEMLVGMTIPPVSGTGFHGSVRMPGSYSPARSLAEQRPLISWDGHYFHGDGYGKAPDRPDTRNIFGSLGSSGQQPFRASWNRNPFVPRARSLFALSGSVELIGSLKPVKQPSGGRLLI
jgi:hypothetical protein